MSPDGSRLILDCDPLTVVDTATFTKAALASGLPNSRLEWVKFDATGQFAYVPASTGVFKVDVIARQIVKSQTLSTGSVRLALDAARNRLYSVPGTWVLDATTLAPLPLGTGGRLNSGSDADGWVVLSPDGTLVSEVRVPSMMTPFGGAPTVTVFNTTTGLAAGTKTLDLIFIRDITVHPSQARFYIAYEKRFSGSGFTPDSAGMVEVDLTSVTTTHEVGPGRTGVLGFKTDLSQVFVGAAPPGSLPRDIGEVATFDAAFTSRVAGFKTTDANGNLLSPTGSITSLDRQRMYVGMIDANQALHPGIAGVLVWNTQTGQAIANIPLFDVHGLALLP
jgi:hypothetical protein